ncbi:cyclodeaminase/cyclohydrolase family protein [Pseudomonas typographi]|uniref:cyclodeaminase/cyclohydrolase family protein n=1 Tax=Pseudomonas typographi TaxID=2715964 RepID=UPI0016858C88|nr:cyclodeaminase/cyclohydrolase family protein [Pseudomonas typographi]MBD1553257.1 hypothetical protein [Pseudomonas typographi]
MSVWSCTLAAFRGQVAANVPVPSCGATACVCAALGLALLLMALRNAQHKAPDADRQHLIEAAERLLPAPPSHAATDGRQNALNVTLGALAGACSCLEGLEPVEGSLPWVAAPLQSELVAAALILHAGLSAMLLNVAADAGELDAAQEALDPQQVASQLQTAADEGLRRIRG